ncbi:hypothetical protein QE152_g10640, partial [Popillia japonica]
ELLLVCVGNGSCASDVESCFVCFISLRMGVR